MQDKVLSLLGLAARAGKTAAGGFSAEEAVRSRKARLVILAGDAQENTTKKFRDKCTFYKIPLRYYGTKEQIGHATGKDSRACIAVTDRGFAESLLKILNDPAVPEAAADRDLPEDRKGPAGRILSGGRAAPEGLTSGGRRRQ